MDSIEAETLELAKADRHLAEGEQRIARQMELLRTFEREGKPTESAAALLQLFGETLQNWRDHRGLIIDRIAVLKQRGKAG